MWVYCTVSPWAAVIQRRCAAEKFCCTASCRASKLDSPTEQVTTANTHKILLLTIKMLLFMFFFFNWHKKRHLNQILYLKRFLFLSFDFLNYKMAKIHLGNYSFWVWFFTLKSKNKNKIITFLYLVVVSIKLYPNCQN